MILLRESRDCAGLCYSHATAMISCGVHMGIRIQIGVKLMRNDELR